MFCSQGFGSALTGGGPEGSGGAAFRPALGGSGGAEFLPVLGVLEASDDLTPWTSGCMNRSACWRWRSGCTTVSVEIQLVFFHRPAVTANSPVVHRVHRDDLIHCLPTAKPKYLGSL